MKYFITQAELEPLQTKLLEKGCGFAVTYPRGEKSFLVCISVKDEDEEKLQEARKEIGDL